MLICSKFEDIVLVSPVHDSVTEKTKRFKIGRLSVVGFDVQYLEAEAPIADG